jgi:ABC-type multidrug transport system fused ATPase/permease subunit
MAIVADTTWDFGDFMLGVLWFFFLFIWIWLLIMVFSDVFRRHDVGGGVKTLWVIFVLLVPYFGVFIYLITQGHGMGERAQKQQEAQVQQLKQQMGYSSADELEKIEALKAKGALTDAEYQQMRAKVLS